MGYVVSGQSLIMFGEHLKQALTGPVSDYFFIPAGMPRAPMNTSGAPCTFVVAHAANDDRRAS